MSYFNEIPFDTLIGKTLVEVKGKKGGDEISFLTDTGEFYLLKHFKNCCESVTVEDIYGDLKDLVGGVIIQAEEVSDIKMSALHEYDKSFTWTFYKLATNKGFVTIRWYGVSNGYYSERVSFVREK